MARRSSMTIRTASELLRVRSALRSCRTFLVSSTRFVRVNAARLMDHSPKCVKLSTIIHNGIVPRKVKGWRPSKCSIWGQNPRLLPLRHGWQPACHANPRRYRHTRKPRKGKIPADCPRHDSSWAGRGTPRLVVQRPLARPKRFLPLNETTTNWRGLANSIAFYKT